MSKAIYKSIPLLLLIFSLNISSNLNAQFIEHLYNFDNLTAGQLDGQDGWTTVLNLAGNTQFVVGSEFSGATTQDGSLGIFYGQPCPNCGCTASRESTPEFPFDFSLGGIVELSVEAHAAWWGTYFGIGYDANDNGYILPANEAGDGAYEANEAGICVVFANNSNVQDKVVLPDGTTIPFEFAAGGWDGYKILIDFQANDGQGSLSLEVRDIPGDWIVIEEVQDINLGLTPNSGTGTDPAMWTKLFAHSTGGTGGFDNLKLRVPDTGGLLFQSINFSALPNRLTTDAPFYLNASASSGLPVSFSITSGPATVDGNTVTLTGDPGIVTVKASQEGNAEYAPAEDKEASFNAIDPLSVAPVIDIRNPLDAGTVMMPTLYAIPLAATSFIDNADVLNIASVEFEINGDVVVAKDWNNGHFTGHWSPPAYGNYTMNVTATSNGGVSYTESVNFEVVAEAENMTVTTLDDVWLLDSDGTSSTDYILPSYVGSFNKITANLNITCPPGGCDPWDRISNIEVLAPNGEWVEIIRYITPYGVPCSHTLDVTDYASLFQGKVEIRASLGTFGNGFYYSLDFEYEVGTPEYVYSWVDVIWDETYPFGNMANLQPVDTINFTYAEAAQASKFKLVNSGHGWGDNNTGNAAEFYEATHHIKVNEDAYEQYLWVDCNPNPDNCQPQNGTWFYDRAGWCPGTIAKVYDYDMTQYVGQSNVNLIYEFYPGYMDLCSSSNPDCVSGVTCQDCEDGSNPIYVVAGNLISYGNSPIEGVVTEINEADFNYAMNVFPNPSNGLFELSIKQELEDVQIEVFDFSGSLVFNKKIGNTNHNFKNSIDLRELPSGIYTLTVNSSRGSQTKRLIIQ